jgi:nicotinate-nucleotide pyrophosphorylase (carboxylating)
VGGGVEYGAAVPAAQLAALVDGWLLEDCPGFDYGGAVVGDRVVRAVLYAKADGVLAGRVFFDRVFAVLGCAVEWRDGCGDGVEVLLPERGGRLAVATVTGPAHLVLQGERVALNALAECSGVATAAARVVAVARARGWRGRVAGTRKTTPGFRLVQKYGMMVGGMDPHRMDLSSMIMLKDNHVAAAGSVAEAVRAAKGVGGFSLKVDVECGDVEAACVAAEAGADVVMLDNFAPDAFCRGAKLLRAQFARLTIEGSGGLTEETIGEYMCDEADVLSFSINRYATPLDMSLKIQPGDG